MTNQEAGMDDEVENQSLSGHSTEVNALLNSSTIDDVADAFAQISVGDNIVEPQTILVCDAGYGLPKEIRPRKEKINAIASQLANFLTWQRDGGELNCSAMRIAQVHVVGCPDEATISTIAKKISDKLKINKLPSHLTLSCETLEETMASSSANKLLEPAVYLSPDADRSLNPSLPPPTTVVVGLLIDRRPQPNRSKDRASKLRIEAVRLPLEGCFVGISAREPLNVDCVLELMQQWWWNCREPQNGNKEAFIKAASQAIEHHAERHPARPLHIEPEE